MLVVRERPGGPAAAICRRPWREMGVVQDFTGVGLELAHRAAGRLHDSGAGALPHVCVLVIERVDHVREVLRPSRGIVRRGRVEVPAVERDGRRPSVLSRLSISPGRARVVGAPAPSHPDRVGKIGVIVGHAVGAGHVAQRSPPFPAVQKLVESRLMCGVRVCGGCRSGYRPRRGSRRRRARRLGGRGCHGRRRRPEEAGEWVIGSRRRRACRLRSCRRACPLWGRGCRGRRRCLKESGERVIGNRRRRRPCRLRSC